jgi:2-oxoglutarate dehydrogenase complex dehydrogenase (E1) component-like enzyme
MRGLQVCERGRLSGLEGVGQRQAGTGVGAAAAAPWLTWVTVQARHATGATRVTAPLGSTSDALKVLSLVSAFRKRGHLVACLDPLGRGLGPLSEVASPLYLAG